MITEDDNGNKVVHRGGKFLEAAQPAPEPEEEDMDLNARFGVHEEESVTVTLKEQPKPAPSLNMTTAQVFYGYVTLGSQLKQAIDAYNGIASGSVYDELANIAKFCEAAIRNCERLLANRVGRL